MTQQNVQKVPKYYLMKGNKFIAVDDTFTAAAMHRPNAAHFDSKDAALDKAEALGIHLDDIKVIERVIRVQQAP